MSKLFSGDFTSLIFELSRLILGFGPLHPLGHSRGTALSSQAIRAAAGPGLAPPLDETQLGVGKLVSY